MLGFEAVVIINATFLIFQLLAWRRRVLLGPLDGVMGSVLTNELSVEVACVISGLSHRWLLGIPPELSLPLPH